MKKAILACIILFSVTAHRDLFSQPICETNPLSLNREELIADWSHMVNTVFSIHPKTTILSNKETLQKRADSLAYLITDSMALESFHILVRKWLTEIGCGHLTSAPPLEWYTRQRTLNRYIPFEVYVDNDQLFIKAVSDSTGTIRQGMEILSINQMSSARILNDMRAIQVRDGRSTTGVDYYVEALFRTYFIFLYGNCDRYTIEFMDANQNTRIATLEPAARLAPAGKLTIPEMQNIRTADSIADLHYPVEHSDIAILSIDAFGFKHYKAFYRRSFRQIRKDSIQHLIIDLRGNGGGYFPNGNTLLRYLMPEDFAFHFSKPNSEAPDNPYVEMGFLSKMTRVLFNIIPDADKSDPARNYRIPYARKGRSAYRNALYVLTDGGTFSMSSYVAAELDAHTNAYIVGEETGGGAAGSQAVLMYTYTMPETNIRLFIPAYYLDHKISDLPYARGVLPGIPLKRNIDAEIRGEDQTMMKLIELIQSHNLPKN